MALVDKEFDIYAPTEHVSLHARRKERIARMRVRRTVNVLAILLMMAALYAVTAAFCAVGPC